MRKISVPWRHQSEGVNFSIELNRWCKDQGLKINDDFNWFFTPATKETIFYFQEHVDSYATLFSLKWSGYEI